MFCAYKDDGDEPEVIAVHDNRRIVESFVAYANLCNHDYVLKVGHIRKESKYKLRYKIEDLYLVRYGKTYIQAGYLLYAEIMADGVNTNLREASETILMVLETQGLSEKETKTLSKALKVLERVRARNSAWTPDLDSLKRLKEQMDDYRYALDKPERW